MKNKLIVLLFRDKPINTETRKHGNTETRKQQYLMYHFKHPCLMGLIREGLDAFIQDIFYPSILLNAKAFIQRARIHSEDE